MASRLLTALALVLSASLVEAQTPTYKLQWNQSEAPAIASGFQYGLTIDGGQSTALAAGCVPNGNGSQCTAPLPTLSTGTHTLIVTAFGNGGSTSSDPFVTSPASKPTNLSITITVVIQ